MPRARVHRHIHIIELAALGPPQPPQGPLVVAAPTGVRRGPAAAARVRRVVGGEGPHGIRLLVSFDGIVDDLYDAVAGEMCAEEGRGGGSIVEDEAQAEEEGLDRIFADAGFDWREPGCSMCLAMNDDKLTVGERAASTSNRNFEGRQGRGGRTHLVSPAMAAAAAITGHLTDVRDF